MIFSQRLGKPTHLLAMTALAVLALVFWLPFGFRVTGLIEEWFIFGYMRTGYPLYWVDSQSVMHTHAIRPMTFFPFALGYTLTPDSFLGLNFVQYLTFVGKGIFTYLLLVGWLRGGEAFAFLVAALFVIYPADAGLFMLRAVNVHWTVMFTLAAIWLLLVYWDSRARWTLPLMWGTLAISLLTYEVAYPLVAVTPLLLVLRARRITHRVIVTSLLWYLVPLLTGLYALQMLLSTSENVLYHTQITQVGTLWDVNQILQSIQLMFWHSLVTGWTEIFTHAPFPPFYWLIGIGVGLGALTVAHLVSTSKVFPWRSWVMGLLAGLVIILLGYLPYLFVPALRFSTIRTYYLSSLGAALCIGALILLLSFGRQRLMIALLSVLVGVAALHGIHQVGYFVDLTQRQQRFIGQLLAAAPTVPPETTIAIIDTTGLMETEWFFGYPQTITSVVQYLYGTGQVHAVRCGAQFPEVVPCEFGADSLTYITSIKADTVPYEKLLVFAYTYDRELQLLTDLSAYTGGVSPRAYQPRLPNSTINPLMHTLFACWPIESCTQPVVSQLERDPLRIEFGVAPLLGQGWRGGETGPGGFDFRWSVQQESTLTFFMDDNADRELELFVRYLFPPTTAEGLLVRVNDTPVEFTLTTTEDGYHYRGLVPGTAFAPAVDTITIIVDVMVTEPATGRQLGIAADWLTIHAMDSQG